MNLLSALTISTGLGSGSKEENRTVINLLKGLSMPSSGKKERGTNSLAS